MYVVSQRMPGYMPDIAESFPTLGEARAYAADLARTWREEWDPSTNKPIYYVTGSARVGHYQITRRDGTGAVWYISIDQEA